MVSTDTRQTEAPPLSSRLMGPIGGMSRLRQSLLFAELSLLSYFDESIVREGAATIGFSAVQFFDRNGAQAYLLTSPRDCVVACRGTEPTDWNDIKADLNAGTVVAETVGRVHRGFKREVDDLWPALENAMVSITKPTWFTGHSLGGAMATISPADARSRRSPRRRWRCLLTVVRVLATADTSTTSASTTSAGSTTMIWSHACRPPGLVIGTVVAKSTWTIRATSGN